MGRDVVALWLHPGDSTALWGAGSLSPGTPSLLLQGLQARSIHTPTPTTPWRSYKSPGHWQQQDAEESPWAESVASSPEDIRSLMSLFFPFLYHHLSSNTHRRLEHADSSELSSCLSLRVLLSDYSSVSLHGGQEDGHYCCYTSDGCMWTSWGKWQIMELKRRAKKKAVCVCVCVENGGRAPTSLWIPSSLSDRLYTVGCVLSVRNLLLQTSERITAAENLSPSSDRRDANIPVYRAEGSQRVMWCVSAVSVHWLYFYQHSSRAF